MRYLAAFIVAAVLMLATITTVYAWRLGKPVTPYGDSCQQCTKYGVCKTIMSHDDSKKAMIDYYQKKGFAVELDQKKGRFIKAKIKQKGETVDVIIFDRRTGRIRSIY